MTPIDKAARLAAFVSELSRPYAEHPLRCRIDVGKLIVVRIDRVTGIRGSDAMEILNFVKEANDVRFDSTGCIEVTYS